MPRRIAINGTNLDEVRMLLEPLAKGALSYLMYPKDEIRFLQQGEATCLIVPAYLRVELYRRGILPQDVSIPVELSVSGRSVGHYVISDVRYRLRSDGLHEVVTFTLTRVPQDQARHSGGEPLSHTAATGQGTFVTDITHSLEENGEVAPMPAAARKLACFLTLLIEAETSDPSAGEHDSGVRCRKKACRGTIRTSVQPGQNEISWYCPTCGQNGVIRNWQDTKWNQLNRNEDVE